MCYPIQNFFDSKNSFFIDVLLFSGVNAVLFNNKTNHALGIINALSISSISQYSKEKNASKTFQAGVLVSSTILIALGFSSYVDAYKNNAANTLSIPAPFLVSSAHLATKLFTHIIFQKIESIITKMKKTKELVAADDPFIKANRKGKKIKQLPEELYAEAGRRLIKAYKEGEKIEQTDLEQKLHIVCYALLSEAKETDPSVLKTPHLRPTFLGGSEIFDFFAPILYGRIASMTNDYAAVKEGRWKGYSCFAFDTTLFGKKVIILFNRIQRNPNSSPNIYLEIQPLSDEKKYKQLPKELYALSGRRLLKAFKEGEKIEQKNLEQKISEICFALLFDAAKTDPSVLETFHLRPTFLAGTEILDFFSPILYGLFPGISKDYAPVKEGRWKGYSRFACDTTLLGKKVVVLLERIQRDPNSSPNIYLEIQPLPDEENLKQLPEELYAIAGRRLIKAYKEGEKKEQTDLEQKLRKVCWAFIFDEAKTDPSVLETLHLEKPILLGGPEIFDFFAPILYGRLSSISKNYAPVKEGPWKGYSRFACDTTLYPTDKKVFITIERIQDDPKAPPNTYLEIRQQPVSFLEPPIREILDSFLPWIDYEKIVFLQVFFDIDSGRSKKVYNPEKHLLEYERRYMLDLFKKAQKSEIFALPSLKKYDFFHAIPLLQNLKKSEKIPQSLRDEMEDYWNSFVKKYSREKSPSN